MAMRLSADSSPINQDSRDQLLRDIQYGRGLQNKINERVATIPQGRPNPYNGDQQAYDAALVSFKQYDPSVTILQDRLQAYPGPYWNDLTVAEKEAMTVWTKSLESMDSITASYFPTKFEMDIKKAILFVIGLGSFIAPLFFTEDTGEEGFPFRVIPQPPELPFDRVPKGLPRPMRTESLPMRPRLSPSEIPVSESIVQSTPMPGLTQIPGGTKSSNIDNRFSRDFSMRPVGSGLKPTMPAHAPIRTPGERRYVYPKPMAGIKIGMSGAGKPKESPYFETNPARVFPTFSRPAFRRKKT